MIKTNNFSQSELVDLTSEITLVAPVDTPLTTLLMGNNRFEQATSKIHSWREKVLDFSDSTVAEGADPNFYQSGRPELNNVCQVFLKGVAVSGSAQASVVKGIPDLFASEVQDRLTELKVDIEKNLINGVKDDGSTSGIRKMQGLINFVDDNNKINGETVDVITEDEVKALARKLWEQGVQSSDFYALVNADLKEKIDELYKNSYSYVAETNQFGLVVDTLRTNYGMLHFVLSRHVPADKIVAFDLNSLAIAYLRQPVFEPLGKTGDSTKGQVVAECTLRVGSPRAVSMYTLKTA